MAKFKPAQNYTVSGNYFLKTLDNGLRLWEKRNHPTVDGEKGDTYNTYVLTKQVKVSSKAYNGTRDEDVVVSEEFNTVEEAVLEAVKL